MENFHVVKSLGSGAFSEVKLVRYKTKIENRLYALKCVTRDNHRNKQANQHEQAVLEKLKSSQDSCAFI